MKQEVQCMQITRSQTAGWSSQEEKTRQSLQKSVDKKKAAAEEKTRQLGVS